MHSKILFYANSGTEGGFVSLYLSCEVNLYLFVHGRIMLMHQFSQPQRRKTVLLMGSMHHLDCDTCRVNADL
jgi:hypothetical protein